MKLLEPRRLLVIRSIENLRYFHEPNDIGKIRFAHI